MTRIHRTLLSKCSVHFHSLTLLLGVVGNLLIIWAILGYRKMKTPTNIFLASLAIADLLLCVVCIPVKVWVIYCCGNFRP